MARIRTPAGQHITVKPHVQHIADELEALGLADSFGTYIGHADDVEEGEKVSIDIFNPVSPAGYAQQDRIREHLQRDAVRLGVLYVIVRPTVGIWNINRDAEGWRRRPVTGDPSTDHLNHTHLTCKPTAPGPFHTGTITPPAPPALTLEDLPMDFTYILDRPGTDDEDFVFSASLGFFGRLPYGATLEGLKGGKVLTDLGRKPREFHAGIVALADQCRMRGDYGDARQ